MVANMQVVGGARRVVVVHAGAVVHVVGAAHAHAAVQRAAVDQHGGAAGARARLVEVAQLVVGARHGAGVRRRVVVAAAGRLPSLRAAQPQPLSELALELFLQHKREQNQRPRVITRLGNIF